MTDLVPVKFNISYSPFTEGEIAGFKKEKAEALVKAGIARYYKPNPIRKRLDSATSRKYLNKQMTNG